MHITECEQCFTQFRDGDEACGVCPKCGHENDSDQDEYGETYLRKVIG